MNDKSVLIKKAGFDCQLCRKPVRVARKAFSFLTARFCIYACSCGPSLVVFEDQKQPALRDWFAAMKFARETGTRVVIYSHDQIPPGVAGLN
jgi:hypothetical protein